MHYRRVSESRIHLKQVKSIAGRREYCWSAGPDCWREQMYVINSTTKSTAKQKKDFERPKYEKYEMNTFWGGTRPLHIFAPNVTHARVIKTWPMLSLKGELGKWKMVAKTLFFNIADKWKYFMEKPNRYWLFQMH